MNLFVDASISANSRTRALALHIIEKIGEPFETVKIDGSTIRALNARSLEVRTEQSPAMIFPIHISITQNSLPQRIKSLWPHHSTICHFRRCSRNI